MIYRDSIKKEKETDEINFTNTVYCTQSVQNMLFLVRVTIVINTQITNEMFYIFLRNKS